MQTVLVREEVVHINTVAGHNSAGLTEFSVSEDVGEPHAVRLGRESERVGGHDTPIEATLLHTVVVVSHCNVAQAFRDADLDVAQVKPQRVKHLLDRLHAVKLDTLEASAADVTCRRRKALRRNLFMSWGREFTANSDVLVGVA